PPVRAPRVALSEPTRPISQDGEASTARQEPSLTDITNRKPFSISTIVWFTAPASKQRAAPWVRLASPGGTGGSWSALARSRRSETAMRSPSAETTIACATPGTLLAKLETSQLRFCASLLSCVIVVAPRGRMGVAASVGIFACCHHPAAFEARTVARQHAPDRFRRPGRGGGRRGGAGGRGAGGGRRGPRGDHPGGEIRPGNPAGEAGLGRLDRSRLERRRGRPVRDRVPGLGAARCRRLGHPGLGRARLGRAG